MDDVAITRGLSIPARELTFRFSRSGGPGGQNVNTRDTKVELIFDVANSPSLGPRQRAKLIHELQSRLDADGRLRIVASEERTQPRNRAVAVERLQVLLGDALRREPKPRKPTRPSATARRKRIEGKRIRAQVKRTRARPVPDD